ncbi:hypothetical protein L1047_01145 [Synechococcus sp. Nb3U1]|uniref:hypothetical protein n=1 Tax=Synechococcus sp. Nb3U1 TaxID=1914529 RepID=UPI001F3B94C1|nr:hypothetical protein [Synechococcus sp. Nb3U1]MCF2969802.1 hypothetical protein [Synechococcus sp. Nb3U1]
MDTSELEFKVQVLARCMGSALGLGRPTRIEIHYCTPQSSEDRRSAADDRSTSPSSPLAPEWAVGSQGVVCAA